MWTGRSTDSESFPVEYGVAGGSWVSIQQPSAMSASIARGPPPTTPAEASNQPEAGISALAVPSPTRV